MSSQINPRSSPIDFAARIAAGPDILVLLWADEADEGGDPLIDEARAAARRAGYASEWDEDGSLVLIVADAIAHQGDHDDEDCDAALLAAAGFEPEGAEPPRWWLADGAAGLVRDDDGSWTILADDGSADGEADDLGDAIAAALRTAAFVRARRAADDDDDADAADDDGDCDYRLCWRLAADRPEPAAALPATALPADLPDLVRLAARVGAVATLYDLNGFVVGRVDAAGYRLG